MSDKLPRKSDTPRTDVETRPGNLHGQVSEYVLASFARTLERELGEAKFSAEHRKHLLEGAVFHREMAELDRDQWKECATELAKAAKGVPPELWFNYQFPATQGNLTIRATLNNLQSALHLFTQLSQQQEGEVAK